jgi:SP family general alpha glucoside:H+ symporter-like MFS transporter
LNGWLAAKYGYRKVIIVALFFLNAFIFITFLAPNKPVLFVGQSL